MIELIVEDGTGSNPLANTYFDLNWFKSMKDLYNTDLDFTDEEYTFAIYKAHTWLHTTFANSFKGSRLYLSQPLHFPRNSFYIDGVLVKTIPEQLKFLLYLITIKILEEENLLEAVKRIPKIAKAQLSNMSVEYFKQNEPPELSEFIVYLRMFINLTQPISSYTIQRVF